MVQPRAPRLSSSSTAITSVDILRPKPQREPSDRRRAAGAARVRQGEYKAGELIPGTRYRVLGLLGIGGMGTVYEVEHTELGKRFVLKALLPELARRQDLVVRIRNEQRALGRLEHPSIVTVTDAGMTSTEVPYFVMERLDGETLGARIKRSGCLGIDEALGIAIGVLEGLSAAHQIGVIHRDIKPQNVFLAARSGPKILDFGVAKVADTGSAITARGVAVGTPRYMSPEQASGEQVDGRSDVYAVGLVLFECLVGRGPFDDARDANEMLLAQLSRVPPRLLGRVPGLTAELDALLAALLAKDADARPSDARAAADALRDLRVRLQQPSDSGTVPRSATVRIGGPAAPLPTTHADGVAARHGGRARLGVTDDAPTVARAAQVSRPNDTLIDERGPSAPPGTATDATFASTLAEHRDPRTRTEILPAVEAGAGDAPTHTRVPLTPTDGSRTLDPVPLPRLPSSARSPRRMRALPWLLGSVAFACGVVAVIVVRSSSDPRALEPAPARAPRSNAALAVTTPASAPPPAVAPVPSPAGVPASAPARELSVANPPPSSVPSLVKRATGPAPAASAHPKTPEKSASGPRIPV
ncbi:MAG TPA: protein kinase, partial [Polyangiaceae bacterium]|nr:protein kinase [Polyangiaceae bacterium]